MPPVVIPAPLPLPTGVFGDHDTAANFNTGVSPEVMRANAQRIQDQQREAMETVAEMQERQRQMITRRGNPEETGPVLVTQTHRRRGRNTQGEAAPLLSSNGNQGDNDTNPSSPIVPQHRVSRALRAAPAPRTAARPVVNAEPVDPPTDPEQESLPVVGGATDNESVHSRHSPYGTSVSPSHDGTLAPSNSQTLNNVGLRRKKPNARMRQTQQSNQETPVTVSTVSSAASDDLVWTSAPSNNAVAGTERPRL